MCGIVGIIGDGDKNTVYSMADKIRHRGPDEDGFYIDESDSIYLGMRRLSIIDLSGGKQPIYNEDKSVVVLYNGEIYNFRELRKSLEDKKHKFYTNTDTEVICHLYEEYGDDFSKYLNGMFAVSLWDKKRQKFVLVRDRAGQKPLYYFFENNVLYFSSELKVFKLLSKKFEVNKKSLLGFIDQGYIAGSDTIYQGVKRLLPGEMLVYRLPLKHIDVKKWWRVENSFLSAKEDESLKTAIQKTESLIEDSVQKRMISDVPLGVFLSGGLDSSLIAYYAQKNSAQPIKTFTIKFPYSSFDESKYAREVASIISSEHIEEEVTGAEIVSVVENLPFLSDELIADTSFVPTYILSQKTRKYVKVALGGDGADELFWGYQTFEALKYRDIAIKFGLNSFFAREIAKRLPVSDGYFNLGFKLKRFLLNLESNIVNAHFRWFSSFTKQDLQSIFDRDFLSSEDMDEYFIYRRLTDADIDLQDMNDYEIASYLYQKYYLPDDILVKTDRASMSVSLEARAPFLDYRIVEYANSMSGRYKFRSSHGKYILKKIAEKYFPHNIVYRKKHGFASPVGRWLRNDLRGLAEELFSHKNLSESMLSTQYVGKIWDLFLKGDNYRERQVWTIFVWLLYKKYYNIN